MKSNLRFHHAEAGLKTRLVEKGRQRKDSEAPCDIQSFLHFIWACAIAYLLVVSTIAEGPEGPVGSAGPAGPLGPAGPAGPAGASGNTCDNTGAGCGYTEMCMPDGTIGISSTEYHCVSQGIFDATGECDPSTFKLTVGESVMCIQPSAVACAGSVDFDPCSFSWGGHSANGLCHTGVCLAACIEGDQCANSQSTCSQGICQH